MITILITEGKTEYKIIRKKLTSKVVKISLQTNLTLYKLKRNKILNKYFG